jgi:hypothetical protein
METVSIFVMKSAIPGNLKEVLQDHFESPEKIKGK